MSNSKHEKVIATPKSITPLKRQGKLLDLSYFKYTHIQSNNKPENIAVELRKKSWTRINI